MVRCQQLSPSTEPSSTSSTSTSTSTLRNLYQRHKTNSTSTGTGTSDKAETTNGEAQEEARQQQCGRTTTTQQLLELTYVPVASTTSKTSKRAGSCPPAAHATQSSDLLATQTFGASATSSANATNAAFQPARDETQDDKPLGDGDGAAYCPDDHLLTVAENACTTNLECNICEDDDPMQEWRSCRQCNYDICQSCHEESVNGLPDFSDDIGSMDDVGSTPPDSCDDDDDDDDDDDGDEDEDEDEDRENPLYSDSDNMDSSE